MVRFVTFGSLEIGDVFASFDKPEVMRFRKVSPAWDEGNAVDIFTFDMCTFSDGSIVYVED